MRASSDSRYMYHRMYAGKGQEVFFLEPTEQCTVKEG